MSKDRIEAIAFDFGNTLCPWGESQYWEITNASLHRACEIAGSGDIDAAREIFSRLRDEDSARNIPQFTDNDLVGILRRTTELLAGRDLVDGEVESVLDAHLKAFIGVCKAPDGLHDMLERLSTRYRLAVLSNYPFSQCIRQSLDSMGLSPFLETVIVSGDHGVIKPSSRLFREIHSTLDLPPEKVLYVGDDWVADVIGACSSGMPCVHILDGRTDGRRGVMGNVFGLYLKQTLDQPEMSGWEEAKPLASLHSVLDLEAWLASPD